MTVAARVARDAGVGVVIVLALVTILTALRTELPRAPGVMSDAVGPDPGEPVAEYLERAAASLDVGAGDDHRDDDDTTGSPDPSTDPDTDHWALVSAVQAWSVADADAVARGLPRVSRLIAQVPVEGVAMPVAEVVLAEPVAGESSREPAFGRGLDGVVSGLGAGREPGPGDVGADRGAQTSSLTAARIRDGDPAIVGLLVRGTPEQLRAVSGRPGVRAVEALPADAVSGRFAVRPLLPQHVRSASPLPDSAPVPAS